MLHGRTRFELNGGTRHLEGSFQNLTPPNFKLIGCYTNLDEFRSRAQVLEKRHGGRGFVQRVGNSNNI